MNCPDEYELYLDREIDSCDSDHAYWQEVDWLAHSQMTDLENRMARLLATKARYREARRFYMADPSLQSNMGPLYKIQKGKASNRAQVVRQLCLPE